MQSASRRMTHEIAFSRPGYLNTNSRNYEVTPVSFRVGGCFAGGQDSWDLRVRRIVSLSLIWPYACRTGRSSSACGCRILCHPHATWAYSAVQVALEVHQKIAACWVTL